MRYCELHFFVWVEDGGEGVGEVLAMDFTEYQLRTLVHSDSIISTSIQGSGIIGLRNATGMRHPLAVMARIPSKKSSVMEKRPVRREGNIETNRLNC